MVGRFASCYELESFSLTRAADLIVQHTARLRGIAARALASGGDTETLRAVLGDLYVQLRALISGASPILVDLAESVGTTNISMSADAYELTHTTAFAVPGLDLRVSPARSADPSGSPPQV